MKNRFPKISIKDLRSTKRVSPWLAIYYKERHGVKKYFKTRAEAVVYKEALLNHWMNKTNPDDDAEANRLVAGTGYSKAAAIKGFFETLRASGATKISPNATISDGIKAYKARQADDESIKKESIASSHALLSCMEKRIGHRIAVGFTKDDAKEFLRTLKNRHGEVGKATTNTRLNYFKLLRGVLRAVGIEKPLPGLPKPSPTPEERRVRFFNIDQVTAIIHAVDPKERGMLILALFAGLRPHLLEQLSPNAVNTRLRTIDIPERLAKDGKAHHLETEFNNGATYYSGLPALIWPWLEAYPFQPCEWHPFVVRIREKVGFWIQDGLRHTAATFYFKIHGLDPVVKLLTHEGQHLAFKHYVGECSWEEAQAFYKLMPDLFLNKPPVPVLLGLKPAINWPSDVELARMLQEKSAMQVSRDLGCSDVAIWKRCKAHGIAKPGRGEWTRRTFGKALDGDMSATGERPAA